MTIRNDIAIVINSIKDKMTMGVLGVKMSGDDVLCIGDAHLFHPIFSNLYHEFITLFVVSENIGIIRRKA